MKYFVRDYLGSVRAIADERGQRIEAMDYLPFGSRWNDPQKTFKMRFARTIQFMNERGTSGDIALLERSENIYYIKEGNQSQFDSHNNILYWNPLQIVRTDKNVFLFPATILAHEAKHGVQKDTMDEKEFQEKLKKDDNNPYDRELEKEVITTTEQQAATEHGDKRKDELTRENHKGEIINIIDNGTLPCDKILEDVRKIVLYHINKIKL